MLLRSPPMIIGLGMTLVLEGIVAIITTLACPVGFGTDASYYRFSVNMPAMLAPRWHSAHTHGVTVPLHAVRLRLPCARTGQRIAVNTGVRERQMHSDATRPARAVRCGGAVSSRATNAPHPTINFSTIASMFCFPFFLRIHCEILQQTAGYPAWLYRFTNSSGSGSGQLSFTIAAFTSDVYKVIEAGIRFCSRFT